MSASDGEKHEESKKRIKKTKKRQKTQKKTSKTQKIQKKKQKQTQKPHRPNITKKHYFLKREQTSLSRRSNSTKEELVYMIMYQPKPLFLKTLSFFLNISLRRLFILFLSTARGKDFLGTDTT